MTTNTIMILSPAYSFILAICAAGAAGLVGAFALMKKTVLAGDVMSHIAIPGLGLAVIWHVNPLVGGGLTLFAGILIIAKLQEKSGLSTEATIGVIFATSVALGALLIHSTEDLVDALFGGFGNLALPEFIFGIVTSILIIVVLWKLRHKLLITLFSPDLAGALGINVNRMNLWFLLIFGLAILTSLRFLGALLVGSLIIIPGAAARQITKTLGSFLLTSSLISIASVLVGTYLAGAYNLDLGPTIVVVAGAIFLLSLLKRQK